MKYSIIVPVYNAEKYLNQCIESVLSQSNNDYELILVNDGSQDNSYVICNQYAQENENIICVTKPNSGVMDTWRKGVEIAKGEYILSLDSDDFWDGDLLKRVDDIVNNNSVDMVVFGYKNYVDGNTCNNEILIKQGLYQTGNNIQNIFNGLINWGCFEKRNVFYLSRINKVIKRDVLLRNSVYYESGFYYGEDNLCTIPCVLDSRSIYVLSEFYPYNYRYNPMSITHSYHQDLWNQFVRLNNLTIKILTDKHREDMINQVYKDSVFHCAIVVNNVIISTASIKDKIIEIRKVLNSEFVKKGVKIMDKTKLSKKERINLLLIRYRMATALTIIKSIIKR